MKMKNRFLLCAAALSAVLLAGCSTPETRIRDNPEAFARLNPDQQSLVRAGRVGIGLDKDAVRIALGDPDRITVRTTQQGQSETWHYVEYVYYESGFIYPGPYALGWGGYYGGYGRHRGWGGGWGGGWWGYEGWGYYPSQVYDRFRIEFQNGKVTSISQENPPA